MRILKEFFSLNRSERRANLFLACIIFIVIALRIFMPEKKIPLEFYTFSGMSGFPVGTSDSVYTDSGFIDPNTAGYELLISAGFSPDQALNIISYREAGGVFRKPEDLYRLYTMDSMTVRMIMPEIKIAGKNPHMSGRKGNAVVEKTDLNLSDSADLVSLPGIGPVLASRIIKYRNLLGGFVSTNQLREVYGIDSFLFNNLSGRITVDTSAVRKIYINMLDYIRHPYLIPEEAIAIRKFRKAGVRFRSVSDLVSRKIISGEKAEKLRHYFDFSY